MTLTTMGTIFPACNLFLLKWGLEEVADVIDVARVAEMYTGDDAWVCETVVGETSGESPASSAEVAFQVPAVCAISGEEILGTKLMQRRNTLSRQDTPSEAHASHTESC